MGSGLVRFGRRGASALGRVRYQWAIIASMATVDLASDDRSAQVVIWHVEGVLGGQTTVWTGGGEEVGKWLLSMAADVVVIKTRDTMEESALKENGKIKEK